MTKQLSNGVAHDLPSDLKDALCSNPKLIASWESLTPLARNEWICWTISVKQQKTREEHIARIKTELLEGKRRPCCWVGCVHRTDKPISKTQKWVLEKQAKKS